MDLSLSPNPEVRAKHWADLKTVWRSRSAIAGAWLAGKRSVADVGCGMMSLRDHLPSGVHYQPVDIVSRNPETIVVDLNADRLPKLTVDAIAVLGVIEYLDDVPKFLRDVNEYSSVVISYNVYYVGDILSSLGLKRRIVGWRNRYTKRRLCQMIDAAKLEIVRQKRIRLGEILIELRPAQTSPRPATPTAPKGTVPDLTPHLAGGGIGGSEHSSDEPSRTTYAA